MFYIHSRIIRSMEKQKNVAFIQEQNQALETDLEIIYMLKVAENTLKQI